MTAFRSQEGVKPRFSRTDRGQDPKVGEGRIERTQPMVFPGKKAADVGIDLATPAVEFTGSEARSRFAGHVEQVTVEVHDANRAADAAVHKGMAEAEKHNGELRALPRPDRVKWLPRKTFGGGAPPSRLR
jgi:hypothetical protein